MRRSVFSSSSHVRCAGQFSAVDRMSDTHVSISKIQLLESNLQKSHRHGWAVTGSSTAKKINYRYILFKSSIFFPPGGARLIACYDRISGKQRDKIILLIINRFRHRGPRRLVNDNFNQYQMDNHRIMDNEKQRRADETDLNTACVTRANRVSNACLKTLYNLYPMRIVLLRILMIRQFVS
eukprot:g63505.t1